MKRENLLKLFVVLFVASLALNGYLLICLAPRKAVLDEMKETRSLLAESRKARMCVPNTNFLTLHYFLAEAQKSLGETERGNVTAIISLDGDKIGTLVREKGAEAAGYAVDNLRHYIERVATKNKDIVVCSLGEQSDEIVILVPNKSSEKEIIDFTANLLEGWRNVKLKYNGEELHVTISAGIAFFPKQADNCDDLYTKADMALQMAKDAGRDRYAVFEEK